MTVFFCIEQYCTKNGIKLPSIEIRKEIGAKAAQEYHSIKRDFAIHKTTSKEPEGEFVALSYPKFFSPIIKRIIAETLRSPKLRKRTGAILVFKARPNSNNTSI